MFEVAWSELLVIAVVALVVLGPKEIPKLFRTFGQITGKLRVMARDFTRAMEDAAEEAGVKDVAKAARNVSSPGRALRDAVGLDDIERDLRSAATGGPAKGPGRQIDRKVTAAPAAALAAAPGAAPEEEADDEAFVAEAEAAPSDIETRNASMARASAAAGASPTAPAPAATKPAPAASSPAPAAAPVIAGAASSDSQA